MRKFHLPVLKITSARLRNCTQFLINKTAVNKLLLSFRVVAFKLLKVIYLSYYVLLVSI